MFTKTGQFFFLFWSIKIYNRSSLLSYSVNFHFNIILSSIPTHWKWSHFYDFLFQIPVCISIACHSCCMFRPSSPSCFDNYNNVHWAMQILDPFVVRFSQSTCDFRLFWTQLRPHPPSDHSVKYSQEDIRNVCFKYTAISDTRNFSIIRLWEICWWCPSRYPKRWFTKTT